MEHSLVLLTRKLLERELYWSKVVSDSWKFSGTFFSSFKESKGDGENLTLILVVACRATYRPESISYSTWKSIGDYNSGSQTPDKSESISFATRPGSFSCSVLSLISPVTDCSKSCVRRRSLGIHLGGG